MSEWAKVRWTEARQIARLIDPRALDAPDEGVTPSAWFGALRDAGRLDDAVTFIGHALPRFEGVAWAAQAIASAAPAGDAPGPVMAAVQDWIADPDDNRRRAAWAIAQADDDDDGAERLLGTAVFFSGGSIAGADQDVVQPAPELSGRLAAAAVITAAYRSPDPEAALREAAAAGDSAAQGR